jgi:hypothetical protein
MKNCTHCEHANWKRTKTGALHPSGDGHCGFEVKLPVLPAAKYWSLRGFVAGGLINRRTELQQHCAHYKRKNDA